ncbi:multiple epidermal growth factor-like domains protein 10 [Physella acuta]|uniref:multiple epidermal growth factor-like domains protein 10 n=1 Tax=Physella acuta TaxID=109671 RepID=UPI0027DD327E|nr:multiple epidermal growth factor-like domains protein 10 [Physella acuta]
MRLSTDNTSCIVCDDGLFGDNCDYDCKCIKENTISCDKINGSCICKPEWTSVDCSQDFNECSLKDKVCGDNAFCFNTVGSFFCFCTIGLALQNRTHCTDCGPMITTFPGYLYSGSYGDYYYVGVVCSWTLIAPDDENISFSFQKIYIYSDTVVSIFDGVNSSYPLLGQESTTANLPLTTDIVRASGNAMHIQRYSVYGLYASDSFEAIYWTHECTGLYYGLNCNISCPCKPSNTDSCHRVRGNCNCKVGWQSIDCSVDINECLDPNICEDVYSICVNTSPGYNCQCKPGLVQNSSTNACNDQISCTTKNCSNACAVTSIDPWKEFATMDYLGTTVTTIANVSKKKLFPVIK